MKETFQYNELLHRVWVIWHHTAELIIKCEDTTFIEKTGLSHQQYVVLLIMALNDEPTTATHIAHHMSKNVNTLSTMLDRMESKGLVKKVRDLVDRRSVSLVMTDEGKRKLQASTIAGWELIEKLLSDFSEEELQSLIQLMEKMRKSTLKELVPEGIPGKLVMENTPEEIEINNIHKLMRLLNNNKD
ncbi:MarR family winged helix-turn-helix transcriptional regulator [Chloroflexota bacterium]